MRYKQSPMPFVQMENISHFLRACQSPPLSLQPHDVFQTIDLYESKDPAQVLQCIGAFSRRAHAIQPGKFTNSIGGKSKGGVMSPQSTGGSSGSGDGHHIRGRGISNTSNGSTSILDKTSRITIGRDNHDRSFESNRPLPINGGLHTSPSSGVSSWSKRTDEGATTPAWNIHQYGYMGGASQGNQGITFGGRRQITTPAPKIPSLAERERKRREASEEVERLRVLAEQAEKNRLIELQAEEERARVAEEQRWIKETELKKKEEAREEEEKGWKVLEERHKNAENEIQAKSERERFRRPKGSDPRLRGQFLSQYEAEQRQSPQILSGQEASQNVESNRIQELEKELERARERERQHERERQDRLYADRAHIPSGPQDQDPAAATTISTRDLSPNRARPLPSTPFNSTHLSSDSSPISERDYLHDEWATHHRLKPPSSPPLHNHGPFPFLNLPPAHSPPFLWPPLLPSSPAKWNLTASASRNGKKLKQRRNLPPLTIPRFITGLQGSNPVMGRGTLISMGIGGGIARTGGAGLGVGGARRQIIGPRVEVRRG